MTAPFDLTVIRYATNPRRRRIDHLYQLPPGDPHDAPMPIDFFVWIARNDKRTILIDSGADAAACAARGHDFLRCPTEGLRAVGIDPGDVTDVITTHLHWDHAGNFDKFPNARFHVQRAEMIHATGPCMGNAFLRRPYDIEQVCALLRGVYGGRVAFHEGEDEVTPGVAIRHVGGHTPGLQIAQVATRRGNVVVASDALHFFENKETNNPFPVLVDIPAYMAGWQVLDRLAETPDHIIPGHDPSVLARYPAVSPALQGIAAKLDVMPKMAR